MPVWAMVFLFFMWFMVDSASKWHLRLQTRFFCRKKIQQTYMRAEGVKGGRSPPMFLELYWKFFSLLD